MFRRFYLMTGLLILLAFVPTLAQDDSPPPLGYASLSEYAERYHIYDFKTQTVQTVERDAPPGEVIYYGAELPPDHVRLQSPYDPTINFEFVATTPIEPNTHIDYDLFRLTSDGTRKLITAHANVAYPAKDYWSPNGIYLYVETDTRLSGAVTLNRLDLRTNQLTPLKQPVLGLNNCQSNTAWCIIRELGVRDGPKYPMTLYVLNRDEGTLQTLGTSVLIFTNVIWLGVGSELLYAIAPSIDHYAIHRYDATTHTDELLAEIQATSISGWQVSANARWLLIEAYLTKEKYGGLYALDLQTATANPISLTEYFTHLSQSPVTSLRWLDADTVIYATYAKGKGRSIYKATLPGGSTRELAHFDGDGGFFDHDWSPDGRWLVLSQDFYNKSPATIYLVSMNGGTQENHLSTEAGQSVCVGWFSEEIYQSQKANLCDMTLGEG